MIAIDASVAIKWILKDEIYSDKAIILYKNQLEDRNRIHVPSLFFIEIANTLITKSVLTIGEAKTGINLIYKANLVVQNPTQHDILTASTLAKKFETSVYDMLYAVIAKENKTTLITADENFIRKTGFKHVMHIKDL